MTTSGYKGAAYEALTPKLASTREYVTTPRHSIRH